MVHKQWHRSGTIFFFKSWNNKMKKICYKNIVSINFFGNGQGLFKEKNYQNYDIVGDMIVANDETLKVKAIENLRKLWIDVNWIDT